MLEKVKLLEHGGKGTGAPASRHGVIEKLLLSMLIIVQLVLVLCAQKTTIITMDGIFTYTLSNNPYAYVFIDGVYEKFPKNNGWLNAHTLRENYIVEPYDRFNYSAVYYLQHYDVHPPLYYFAVHTICSLFPGTYSNLYALVVNLIALFFADLVLIRLFGRIYGKAVYGAVPIILLMSMEVMQYLCTYARMYMMLFLFCAWYLYIHEKLLRRGWEKTSLVQMVFCIFLGTLTHYYFYIYAASLTVLMICFLMIHKRRYELLNYIYSGISGIALSWICYPWVLWHIFVNTQGKHTEIVPWSLEKLKTFIAFLNKRLVNGRGWTIAVFLILLCLEVLVRKKKVQKDQESAEHSIFRKMALGSGLLYSLVIFTLDGGSWHYSTALYMAFIVWASMILLDVAGEIPAVNKKAVFRVIVSAVCIIVLFSPLTIRRYIEKTKAVKKWICDGKPLLDEFRQIPKRYANYDCLYVDRDESIDSLLHCYWFEFGEYEQFKLIRLQDVEEYGITDEDMKGRGSSSEGVVVYAPKECLFDEQEYRWLASDGDYSIYEYIGRDVR